MNFGAALDLLRNDTRVRRAAWSSPDMWIARHEQTLLALSEHLDGVVQPYLLMHRFDGSFMPWTPSQVDLLAEDWEAVE